jgi:hypothetical protein
MIKLVYQNLNLFLGYLYRKNKSIKCFDNQKIRYNRITNHIGLYWLFVNNIIELINLNNDNNNNY